MRDFIVLGFPLKQKRPHMVRGEFRGGIPQMKKIVKNGIFFSKTGHQFGKL